MKIVFELTQDDVTSALYNYVEAKLPEDMMGKEVIATIKAKISSSVFDVSVEVEEYT